MEQKETKKKMTDSSLHISSLISQNVNDLLPLY